MQQKQVLIHPAHREGFHTLGDGGPGLSRAWAGVLCGQNAPTPSPFADGHGYSPSLSKCWASGGLEKRARHMSGARVGGIWGRGWRYLGGSGLEVSQGVSW